MNAKAKQDAYEQVTEAIIAKLEEGLVPWHRPWAVSADGHLQMPTSMSTKKPYRGVNVFLLAMQGYTSPWWGTYKQITERGGQVRKGEHGTQIVFWRKFEVLDGRALKQGEYRNLNAEDRKRVQLRFSLKTFTVFNAEQADGLESLVPAPIEDLPGEFKVIDECDYIAMGYLRSEGAPRVEHRGSRACYSPSADKVTMPPRKSFDGETDYYATLFHELTHSTGHSTRLDRKEAFGNGFGTEKYSKEELVAEMGAAMLSAVAGISDSVLDNSASYVQGWLKAIKGDSKLVVQAAAQAQKAADLILGTTFGEEA